MAVLLSEGDLKIRVSPASRPLLRELGTRAKVGGTWQPAPAPPAGGEARKSCLPRFSSGESAGNGALSPRSGAADPSLAVGRPTVHYSPMAAARRLGGRFTAAMFRHPGPGGWHFVPVPEQLAPPVTHGWGRTPVRATVDGRAWDTSVWKDTKSGRTLLAVPLRIRGAKGHGDVVAVELEFKAL